MAKNKRPTVINGGGEKTPHILSKLTLELMKQQALNDYLNPKPSLIPCPAGMEDLFAEVLGIKKGSD